MLASIRSSKQLKDLACRRLFDGDRESPYREHMEQRNHINIATWNSAYSNADTTPKLWYEPCHRKLRPTPKPNEKIIYR